MKNAILILLSSTIFAAGALAAPKIETGAELASACEAFSKLDEHTISNAVHPHHCYQFLVGFFAAFAEGEQADRNARIMGTMQTGKPAACVHLPDYLSYRGMAAQIVAQAKRDPSLLQGPAVTLAQRTLEHDFPCAPGKPEAR